MPERLLYGINAARLALQRRARDVRRVYLQQDLGRERRSRLADVLAAAPLVEECSADDLARLAGTDKHQGVAVLLADSGPLSEGEARALIAGVERPLVLALDGIQDPRNFGACLRTAEAAGADLVVVARHRNVDLTPTVSKVAAGAAESQPLAQVANLVRFLESLKSLGTWVIGTDAAAPRSIYDVDLTSGIALVVGAEGEGLRRLTRDTCDLLASLPVRGSVESLNVAVAAGVCLYECQRQRRAALPATGTVR
jgi:23S rRNA (guanosine2251-2'-O)-methyltransferase